MTDRNTPEAVSLTAVIKFTMYVLMVNIRCGRELLSMYKPPRITAGPGRSVERERVQRVVSCPSVLEL